MLNPIPQKQVMLLFKSITAISQFKRECICSDFYIDREDLTLVGSFSNAQIQVAVEKYEAKSKMMA